MLHNDNSQWLLSSSFLNLDLKSGQISPPPAFGLLVKGVDSPLKIGGACDLHL